MGGSQNYDPFLGTRNIRCRITIGIQKGTNILTWGLLRAVYRPKTLNSRLYLGPPL